MPVPNIPSWIRVFTPPPGWTNVFELVPNNKHLYGTETLFGDWDGETLLLAKDGAPTPVIRALRDKGEPRPWRHAQRALGDPGGYKTNERLAQLATLIPGKKIYGSATANLLYDDPRWSRALPGFYSGPLHDYLRKTLEWVLETMLNVRRIACLGNEAWFLTCTVLGSASAARRFAEFRDSAKPIRTSFRGKPLTAHALYHPAARVSNESTHRGWAAMAATT